MLQANIPRLVDYCYLEKEGSDMEVEFTEDQKMLRSAASDFLAVV